MELLLDAVKRYDFIISERLIINFFAALMAPCQVMYIYIYTWHMGLCGLFFFKPRVK